MPAQPEVRSDLLAGGIDYRGSRVVCCASMTIETPKGAETSKGVQPLRGAPTAKSAAANVSDRLSIRIDLASGARIGPGKIAVLEAIAMAGSISGAGRALKMSYRRTWELVEELNHSFGTAVVETAAGGTGGGGTVLTKAGKTVVSTYRAIELDTAEVARKHLLTLNRVCPGKPR
jgi:molybdate transport system regulatory protein